MSRTILALGFLLAAITGCRTAPIHLQRFEHIADDGSRISYTVNMFRSDKERLNGYWVSYYPNTNDKRTEGTHLNGQMHGVWSWWDTSGQVVGQQLFDHGEVIEEKTSPPWWNY